MSLRRTEKIKKTGHCFSDSLAYRGHQIEGENASVVPESERRRESERLMRNEGRKARRNGFCRRLFFHDIADSTVTASWTPLGSLLPTAGGCRPLSPATGAITEREGRRERARVGRERVGESESREKEKTRVGVREGDSRGETETVSQIEKATVGEREGLRRERERDGLREREKATSGEEREKEDSS